MISVKNVLIKLKLLKMCFLKREGEQNIQETVPCPGPQTPHLSEAVLEKGTIGPSCGTEQAGLWQKMVKTAIKKPQSVGVLAVVCTSRMS